MFFLQFLFPLLVLVQVHIHIQHSVQFVHRYGLFSSMAIVTSTLRSMLFVLIGLRVSKSMHTMLLSGVLLGRILNRFTTDLTITDEALATNVAFLLSMISSILGYLYFKIFRKPKILLDIREIPT